MEEKNQENNSIEEAISEPISRRKILAAGAAALGAVAVGGVFGVGPASSGQSVKIVVDGKVVSLPVPATTVKGTTVAPIRTVAESLGAKVKWDNGTVNISSPPPVVGGEKVPEWPWPYKKLDPELVRRRGYDNYFLGGCGYGAFSALIVTLNEVVGFPYNTVPMDMFKYAAGGSVSWGTLCGALNGASAVINMVTKDYSKLVSELNGWYTGFPFPSDKHEAYCKLKKQITTVAKSPLCHVSVSIWVNANNPKERVNEDGKKDRCAKLTGDVAAKAAELLNGLILEQKFVAAYKTPEEFAHCMSCHTGTKSLLDNQQGQMNCLSCHDDHTKK
jgi:hypothetical protein